MSIVLDTPEQINAWVLLSRISQCHLHMKGLKVPGLAKWLKANVPDITTERTVRDMYPRLLDYCDTLGISAPGDEMCNYQVLIRGRNDEIYLDYGIYPNLDVVAEEYGDDYRQDLVIIMRTMEVVRPPDQNICMVMK